MLIMLGRSDLQQLAGGILRQVHYSVPDGA